MDLSETWLGFTDYRNLSILGKENLCFTAKESGPDAGQEVQTQYCKEGLHFVMQLSPMEPDSQEIFSPGEI